MSGTIFHVEQGDFPSSKDDVIQRLSARSLFCLPLTQPLIQNLCNIMPHQDVIVCTNKVRFSSISFRPPHRRVLEEASRSFKKRFKYFLNFSACSCRKCDMKINENREESFNFIQINSEKRWQNKERSVGSSMNYRSSKRRKTSCEAIKYPRNGSSEIN